MVALCPWLRKYRYPQYLQFPEEEDDLILIESGELGLSAMIGSNFQLSEGIGSPENAADQDARPDVDLGVVQEEKLDGQKACENPRSSNRVSAFLRSIPLLTLDDMDDIAPVSEAEAISQMRRSLLLEHRQSRRSLMALQLAKSSKNLVSPGTHPPSQGQLDGEGRSGSRRGVVAGGTSRADMIGRVSVERGRSREAYLELEVESLRNQNRELMRQLAAMKANETKEE